MAVIEYIEQDAQHKDLPIIIYGLSMGGSTAINVAGQTQDVDGIVAISPYRSIQTRVDHSRVLYEACSSNKKELWIAQGQDHLIVNDVLHDESRFYRERIDTFLNEYF